MHEYQASVIWVRESGPFADGRYSRNHQWQLGGGAVCRASASPQVVPVPYSDPGAIDPEEAFVAAISSCHMLWFLDLARQAGHEAEAYHDPAVGQMSRAADGGLWMAKVTLFPTTRWAGPGPDDRELQALHETAHEKCYIAQSVKTEVEIRLT